VSKPFGRAVVIGKFWPFHRGHAHLLRQAVAEAELVTVIVCDKRDQDVPASVRRAWIETSFPSADVRVVDQDALGLADDDTNGWARATRDLLGGSPDVVFTSERYGDAYALELGCAHRLVDLERRMVPISGSTIRSNPLEHLDFLEPHVRAWYVKRVCILGAESTGKTTLARALADLYRTTWVPEYGAVYEAVGREHGGPWTTHEFVHIAAIRNWLEDLLAGHANRVLFCDTDSFVTARWHERYLGSVAPEVERLSEGRRYDLYLLCDVGTTFAMDEHGFRQDGPHREEMDDAYRAYVRARAAPHVELSGSEEQRVADASEAVDRLLGLS
jgi:NadR type nicotinamide-nucleotide adenylyltransferase